MEATKGIDDPARRLTTVLAGSDPAATFAWRSLRDTLLYAFERVPEIADDVPSVDLAMRWGFNWDLGPFEMLDAIGVREFVRRAEADGVAVPAALREVERFYVEEGGRRRFLEGAAVARRRATLDGRHHAAVAQYAGLDECLAGHVESALEGDCSPAFPVLAMDFPCSLIG